MKHLNEDDLILLHYGESRSRQAEAHLRECAACRGSLQELNRVLSAIQPEPIPQRDQLYGNAVWNRIRAHLPEKPAGWRERLAAWWNQKHAWATASAVAALVVAAFLAGRFWVPVGPTPGPIATVRQPQPEKVRERVLLVAVGSHLERSQMVLIELANTPATDGIDISREQERAQELLSANRLYRQSAAQAGDANVAGVLEQLERVLIEIAHRPSKLSKADVESLRRQIEAQGLVFKIRVVETNVRNELRKGRPEPQQPASALPRQTT
ncbi:MAG: hypothetical protein L0Z53_27660 [Acidobacteriales bacterium]|nr:hypothetical protein [Terriglobales bacterium]